MATEFVATVKTSGGDYTSLSNAESGLQNDLTVADIKVFSISANSNPTITAGDTVLGQTSGATGVCVLVNAASTQILIKTIAVASFQSGEVVQKTSDSTRTVTLSNAGDSPIVIIDLYAMSDTTAAVILGWNANVTNYLHLRVPVSERHTGKWTSTAYTLSIAAGHALDAYIPFTKIEGLQINGNNTNATNLTLRSFNMQALKCLSKGAGDNGIASEGVNCSIYNIISFNSTHKGFYLSNGINVYNCDAIDNGTDGFGQFGTHTLINCLGHNNTTADFNVAGSSVTYCASKDATADDNGGTGNRVNQTFTFVDYANDDFHLASGDAGAKDFGLSDPGSGLFSDDIDSVARTGTWDIGADEFVSTTSIKTINGLAKTSVKTFNSLAIANVKTFNGLA